MYKYYIMYELRKMMEYTVIYMMNLNDSLSFLIHGTIINIQN